MAGRQPPSPPDVKPFVGFVETTLNALRLIQAARQGVIPRITRRLNDAERRSMIKSGSTFVFGVEESGIKRWTDGLLWSPSRIVGNFLVGIREDVLESHPDVGTCRSTEKLTSGQIVVGITKENPIPQRRPTEISMISSGQYLMRPRSK